MLCLHPCLVTVVLLLSRFAQVVNAAPRARPDPKLWHKDYRHPVGPVGSKRQVATNECHANPNNAVTAPQINPFRDLSPPEVADVAEWLFSQPDLNLTASDAAGEWDNTIALIEALPPNKTNVMAFLDDGAPEPTRYAHVVLEISSVADAYYADIVVGPVPIDNATASWAPLEYPYTRKSAGRVRNLEASYETMYTEWVYQITASVADITLFLYNGTVMGLENDTLSVWPVDPYWQDDGRIIR